MREVPQVGSMRTFPFTQPFGSAFYRPRRGDLEVIRQLHAVGLFQDLIVISPLQHVSKRKKVSRGAEYTQR